jgi:hypothetical protein
MTFDKLEDIFWDAFDKEVDIRGDNGNGERAGIRAVVEALRDEMTKLGALEFQDGWTVLHKFNEILAKTER